MRHLRSNTMPAKSPIEMWGETVAEELEDILDAFNKATDENRQEIDTTVANFKQAQTRGMVRTQFKLAMLKASIRSKD